MSTDDEKPQLEQLRLYFANRVVDAKRKIMEGKVEVTAYHHAQEMCEAALADIMKEKQPIPPSVRASIEEAAAAARKFGAGPTNP